MTDFPIRDAGQARQSPMASGYSRLLAGRGRRRPEGWTAAWLATWRTAAAAENAYDTARAHGQPRDVAAGWALDAFARANDPSSDGADGEMVRRLVDSGHGEAPQRPWHKSVRELDLEMGGAANPNDAKRAHGELCVAALCLGLIAALIVLGFAVSIGTRSPS